MTSISRLLQEGRIEQIEADPQAAAQKLDEARRHLQSAGKIIESDIAGAYALLYDAARKALDAHMLSKGYRVAKGEGGHKTTGEYGVAVFGKSAFGTSVRHFDAMRRQRNRSEYWIWHIDSAKAREDLRHANLIVDGVKESLPKSDAS